MVWYSFTVLWYDITLFIFLAYLFTVTKTNFRKGGIIWAHGLLIKSIMVQKSWEQNLEAVWCIHNQEKQWILLLSSFFSFIQPGTPSTERCSLHLGQILHPSIELMEKLLHRYPNSFCWGSKSCQTVLHDDMVQGVVPSTGDVFQCLNFLFHSAHYTQSKIVLLVFSGT